MTCPTGGSEGAIAQMQQKAQGWLAKASASKLNKRNLLFLLDKQFWPGVSFGISSICAPFVTLEDCLMKVYYDLLPLCGIRRSVKRELRQLERGFYVVGLPHPGVECFIGQLDKLLTHYGSSSGLGVHMQVSMEVFIIEGGVSTQLLSEPFARYGKWVTHCWLRSLWEKVEMFGFRVEIAPLPLQPPREKDCWLMLALIDHGFSKNKLIRLNQVRCHQQVLFISDIFDASGRALDQRYLSQRSKDEAWSTLFFPWESPPYRDIRLWQQALRLLAPWGRASHRLGRFTEKGYKIWEWRLNPECNRLYKTHGSTMDMYLLSNTDGCTRWTNRWSCAQRDVPRVDRGTVCTVSDNGSGDVSIICQAKESWTAQPTLDFWGCYIDGSGRGCGTIFSGLGMMTGWHWKLRREHASR
jgi:hypothetical protein